LDYRFVRQSYRQAKHQAIYEPCFFRMAHLHRPHPKCKRGNHREMREFFASAGRCPACHTMIAAFKTGRYSFELCCEGCEQGFLYEFTPREASDMMLFPSLHRRYLMEFTDKLVMKKRAATIQPMYPWQYDSMGRENWQRTPEPVKRPEQIKEDDFLCSKHLWK